MRTTSAAMSGLVDGRPGRRAFEPSYFLATSRGSQRRIATSRTSSSTSLKKIELFPGSQRLATGTSRGRPAPSPRREGQGLGRRQLAAVAGIVTPDTMGFQDGCDRVPSRVVTEMHQPAPDARIVQVGFSVAMGAGRRRAGAAPGPCRKCARPADAVQPDAVHILRCRRWTETPNAQTSGTAKVKALAWDPCGRVFAQSRERQLLG